MGEAAVVFDQEAQEQLLLFAPQLIKSQGVGIVRKSVDLALNEAANLLGGDRSELRLQRSRVVPDLSFHIKIAGDNAKRECDDKKAEAPHQEATPDTAATERNQEFFDKISHDEGPSDASVPYRGNVSPPWQRGYGGRATVLTHLRSGYLY